MNVKRAIAVTAATGAVLAGVVSATAATTTSSALCTYTVAFGHMPGASAGTNPPSVSVDDGSPTVRKNC